MTFTEAALEVLRSAGEPLHYKKITELAIERNLLSHVGKTPEVTMSSRLATMVKKDRGSAPIIKVKPGVFAIREDLQNDPEALSAALERLSNTSPEASDEANGVNGNVSEAPALPGADVFPEEEDDDDPILAGLEEDDGDNEDRGRRRRRRRRRGRGDADGEGDEVSARSSREGRNGRGRDRDRDRDRDRGRKRDERAPEPELDREPGDGDLLGKGLADAVWAVLSRSERGGVTFARAAELLVRRGRMSGQGAALAPTIAAALRADVAARERAGEVRRFLLRRGKVALTDWLLPKELARAGDAAERSAERQREQARRAWLGKMNDLPLAGFAELLATWLNAEGVTTLRAVRRPGSVGQELHFAGTQKRGPIEERLAIVAVRGGREIDRETVVRVRGALHHYGNATGAWILTTGRVSSGAKDEVAAVAAAPVALFEGNQLAAAMEACGIGLRSRKVAISEIDFELLEALGGDIGLRDARRERDSDGDESRDGEPRRRRGRRDGRDEESSEADEVSDESASESDAGEGKSEGQAEDKTGDKPEDKQEKSEDKPEDKGEGDAQEGGSGGTGRRRSRRRRGRSRSGGGDANTDNRDRSSDDSDASDSNDAEGGEGPQESGDQSEPLAASAGGAGETAPGSEDLDPSGGSKVASDESDAEAAGEIADARDAAQDEGREPAGTPGVEDPKPAAAQEA